MPNSHMTLEQFNAASEAEAVELFQQHFPPVAWLDAGVLTKGRPFSSLAALKQSVANSCHGRTAHEIAVWATAWQSLAFCPGQGNHDSPVEIAEYRELGDAYQDQFGWPFLLAPNNARGQPHTLQEATATLKHHLNTAAHLQRQETIRQIQRIAELKLHEIFGETISMGERVWDWQESLARHTDDGFAEKGGITVTYLTPAHQCCARQIVADMRECGCDEVWIDPVGNVIGRYHGAEPGQPMLMTGSHYDTVRHGGKHDGRLGIYVPLACILRLSQTGRRLPFGIEVVAFSEEEGQRFKATFLASSALTGQFDPGWLLQTDNQGISMQEAMRAAGLQTEQISCIKRNPTKYMGFVEVHIEQGPVLYENGLPLGVVTSINGSKRYLCEARGTASHAGTTPMNRRNDAACAVAELMLYAEARAAQEKDAVATVGMLEVPGGSINVIPGRCKFSLDVRAPADPQRDAVVADILNQANTIGAQRGVSFKMENIMQVNAAPSDPAWQRRWEQAVSQTGAPVFRLPSGAGHDAMKIHHILPQAMLFVRGEHGGISHNPLESTTAHDMDLAVQATMNLLNHLETELRT